MKNTELQTLDNHIRNRITQLQSLLEAETSEVGQNDESKNNSSEKLSADIDRQITAKEKQELARLRANLRWLGSDEGGCCEQCGSEIPYARLRAVPETRLCINCAK